MPNWECASEPKRPDSATEWGNPAHHTLFALSVLGCGMSDTEEQETVGFFDPETKTIVIQETEEDNE